MTDKENTDSNQMMAPAVKKMREYQDPLLKAFDEAQKKQDEEDGVSSSGESETSSEEEQVSDIKFPKTSAQDLLQFIMRDLNNLSNMEDGQKRKFSLLRLYEIFVLAKNKAVNSIYQELLPEVQKKLFKALFDKLEKCRELAALIIKEFFIRCDDLTLSMPYLLPIIIERLDADNLEGVDYLDEKLKPASN